jgi:DNA invertase Pin-like site-specific DNA recombinase
MSLLVPLLELNPIGKMHMQIIGVFAEFERAIIRERTKLGLERARAKGHFGGGKFILSPAREADAIRAVLGGETLTQVAKDQDVSKATISRLMARARTQGRAIV